MKVLRTPDDRFVDLPDFAFAPRYVEVLDGEGGMLRVHYIEEGPSDVPPVLLLHGEPTWCFLYRKMIPTVVQAGHRAVAPDLVGFGRSDKPASRNDYSYARHMDWMRAALFDGLDLRDITLVCQDWGALIGLRLAAEHPDRFTRIVVANGGLPTGDQKLSDAFFRWQSFARDAKEFDVGRVVANGCTSPLDAGVLAGHDAPFPDDSYKEGARVFPSLVPTSPDDPAAAANRAAWEVLSRWEKPLLTAFSDADPITHGGERVFQQRVPGAQGQPHTTIKGAGHFLQEDRGEELAQVVVDFISRTPHPAA